MKYFTITELSKSSTASRLGIKNEPNATEKKNLEALIDNVLDPLREAYGKPIIVNSGFRCPKLNKAVGGSSTSQHCLDRNTEILTTKGWKTYKTITSNDVVFSYNIEKDIIEPVPIEDIIIRNYKGNLYYADTKHVNFAVTNQHRMLIKYASHKYQRKNTKNISIEGLKYFDSLKTDNDKYHIEEAKDIYKKRRIFKVAGISNNINSYDVNILRLCMATIADGFLTFKDNRYHGIGFNLKKERDKTEIEDILNSLKWHYTKSYSITHEKQGESGVYSYFINSTVSKEIYQIIGRSKKIPYWFLSLKPDILKQLVISYAKFDGTLDTRENHSGITIFSKDEYNIDMLQIMCVLSGMRAIKKEFKNLEVSICDHTSIMPEFYHLYITLNAMESRVNEDKYHKFYYDSVVWCVLDRNGTIITRRNGKVTILGNCLGQAADIRSVQDTVEENKKIHDLIVSLKLPFDQLINEYNYDWVHVSYGPKHRRTKLKAIRSNGKTVYTTVK